MLIFLTALVVFNACTLAFIAGYFLGRDALLREQEYVWNEKHRKL